MFDQVSITNILQAAIGALVAALIIGSVVLVLRNIRASRWAKEWAMVGNLLSVLDDTGEFNRLYNRLEKTPYGRRAIRILLNQGFMALEKGKWGRLWLEMKAWRFTVMHFLMPVEE